MGRFLSCVVLRICGTRELKRICCVRFFFRLNHHFFFEILLLL